MENKNILSDKSYKFALRIIKLNQFLTQKNTDQQIRLADIVFIYYNDTEEFSYQARLKEQKTLNTSPKCMACIFAEALFDDSRAEDRHALVEAGLAPSFIQNVTQTFQPGRFAYLIHVSRESLIDSRYFLELLRRQQGIIYHTTFHHKVEDLLRKSDA